MTLRPEMEKRIMSNASNLDHRELTEIELRDEELEQVVGGSVTRKIDVASPKLFEMACSGTAFKG